MIQLFHWYSPADGSFWKDVQNKAPELAQLGFTAAWLPPAYKAAGGAESVGYDVYDLYDLGEFDQKGSVRTKYGTREEYLAAVKALQDNGINVIVDIVLNHMGGGDETETITAVEVNNENRNEAISEPVQIETFTKFTFPGRQGKYSQFVWDHQCFSGVDFDNQSGKTAVYNILQEWGNDWDEILCEEKGNYDYLMFNDVEFRNPALREELIRWGLWYYHTVGFDGMRLDAVKHIPARFYREWLAALREETGRDLFAVGEYWAPGNLEALLRYLDATEGSMSLFDSALQQCFHEAGKLGGEFDLRTILDESLMTAVPDKAVTLVDNHDTQPLQALEAPVEHWFKPLAYALILLRSEGYPCVFYPDLYGAHYVDKGNDGEEYEIFLNTAEKLPFLLKARREFAYGIQHDYFDFPTCIGWTREGDEEHEGCAVVMSNGDAGTKTMYIGERYAGRTFRDLLENHEATVLVNEEGIGDFFTPGGSVSVWVSIETKG